MWGPGSAPEASLSPVTSSESCSSATEWHCASAQGSAAPRLTCGNSSSTWKTLHYPVGKACWGRVGGTLCRSWASVSPSCNKGAAWYRDTFREYRKVNEVDPQTWLWWGKELQGVKYICVMWLTPITTGMLPSGRRRKWSAPTSRRWCST